MIKVEIDDHEMRDILVRTGRVGAEGWNSV